VFEYDGNPHFVTNTTIPLGLNVHETFFNLNEPDILFSEIIYPGKYLAQSSIIETITINLTADNSHSITLFDLTGKPQATYTTTQTQYVIDKSKFAHGVYLIVIQNKDTSVKVKIVL